MRSRLIAVVCGFSATWATVFLAAALAPELAAAELRSWSRADGSESFEAELLMAQEHMAWFCGVEGNVFRLPPAELSDSDRALVARMRQQQLQQQEQMLLRDPARIRYRQPKRLAVLQNRNVCESSGLDASCRHPGLFWTHNDSGDAARVYLFDRQGNDRGSFLLADVFAYDWEDITSFRDGGKCYLLLCDVGNNVRAAPVQMLHLVEEPSLDARGHVASARQPVLRTFFVAYEDDFRDCEAVAIDPTDKAILLATKEREPVSYVYRVEWPPDDYKPNKALIARKIAAPAIPPVTAMDISPDGHRAILLTYGNAFEFIRGETESWAEALAKPPRQIEMPERVQGESICYGPDGRTLYLTSEKLPTPLWEVPCAEQSEQAHLRPAAK